MNKCTFKNFPVSFYGKLITIEDSPLTDHKLCTVEGCEDYLEVPLESVELINFTNPQDDILVITYHAGDAEFNTLVYLNELVFEQEKFDTDIGSEDDVEALIANMGLTAPRISKEHIEHCVKDVYFHVMPGSTLTICVLTLTNGFNVVGKSACVSSENFNARLGRSMAYRDAKRQIGELEGYLLAWALSTDKSN